MTTRCIFVTLLCVGCVDRPLSLGTGDGGATDGGNTNGNNNGTNGGKTNGTNGGKTNGTNGGNNNGTNGGNTNGGPPAVAPRLIAPLSTATVTSQQPRLRWDMTGVTGDATLDLCADRACQTLLGSATVDASGAAATPDAALPAGTVFWRVSAGGQSSATWEFFVGHKSAPVDTSYGALLDLDGDGVPEVAVGAAGGGVAIYAGGALTNAPQLIANPDDPKAGFGYVLSAAGDLNGDGYGDLAVGECGKVAGQVHVYFGGPGGVSAASSQTLASPDNLAGFGCRLAGAGDLDGDGYADLAVSRVGPDYGGGLYIYKGGPMGLPTTATRIDSPDYKPSRLGNSLAAVGDLDGDGYADLVATEIDVSALSGRVHIYTGGPDGISNSRQVTLRSPDPQSLQYGASVAGVGDLNGDGYADFAVGSPAVSTNNLQPKVHLYFGGSGPVGGSVMDWTEMDVPNNVGFGVEVEPAGDVDGDGYSDLVVAANATVTLLRGVPAGALTGLSLDAKGQGANPRHLSAAGDVDGDGLADVLVVDGAGLEVLLGGADGLNRARLISVSAPSGSSFTAGIALRTARPAASIVRPGARATSSPKARRGRSFHWRRRASTSSRRSSCRAR